MNICNIVLVMTFLMPFNMMANESVMSSHTDIELKKTNSKEFMSDKSTLLEISNRYGKIDVKVWNNDVIKITSTIIVRAGSKAKGEDKMKEINVSIEKKGNTVQGITDIVSGNSSWWNGWWGSNGNTKIEINYEVFMPADIPSILENKYGNIYLAELNAKTSINLKYGNLEARNINNDLLLDLSYGKVNIGTVKNLNGSLSYSDYRGTGAEVVILTTKYSKMYLDHSKSLTASSKYDTYKLGTVQILSLTGAYDDISIQSLTNGTLNSKYSGTEIASLGGILAADISYGSLVIQNLKTTFKQLTAHTSYAPIKIYGTVPAKIDVEGKYFDVDLGADFISISKVSEGSSKSYKGYKGRDNTGATITIVTKYGDVVIK